MPSRSKVLGQRTIGGEEPLRVSRGLEALHAPLALAGWLVGVFYAVIQIPVLAVFHPRQQLLLRSAVAFQLVGDDHPGYVLAPCEPLAEERLRRRFVPAPLHQNIQPIPVLVHRSPELVAYFVDGEHHLVSMPLIARSGTSTPSLVGVWLSECPTPGPHSFVREKNATGGHEGLDISVAQTKAEVEPDAVTDDLGREAVTLVLIGWWVHAASMSRGTGVVQVPKLI
jgi:hypothetical protein